MIYYSESQFEKDSYDHSLHLTSYQIITICRKIHSPS